MKISEIMEKVSREEWVLPVFQREFVWNDEKKIIEYIESIFNEWPIGSIILWVPDPKDGGIIKKRQLQTKLRGNPQYLQEYIIDGQQRITTVMKILNDESFIFRGREKKMCYDFESDEFVFYDLDEELPINVLPLFDILDETHAKIKNKLNLRRIFAKNLILTSLKKDKFYSEDEIFNILKKDVNINKKELHYLLAWLVSRNKIKEENEKYKVVNYLLKELGDIDEVISKIKKIKDYEITIQKPKNSLSLRDAQELFIRLNTGGKQLPSVDLALAYISLLWSDSRDEFKKFKESLRPTGFYFDVNFFVRCLSAVSLKQSLTRKLIRSFKIETIREDWIITKLGIRKTIDFLRGTLNLSSNLFLEAENTLVPIVLLFSKREEKIKNRMNLLGYWFIISYINKRFSGQSTATLNKDIKTILESKDPINGLIKNLEDDRSILITNPRDIKGNQFKFILYVLLKRLRTKDFITGFGIDSISASKSNRLDFHHIFADSLLRKSKFKDKKEDIANKTFLTNKSNKKLSDSDPTYLLDYPKELLRAHLIPDNESLWKFEKYEEFLEERRKLISKEVNKLLNELKKRYI